MMHTVAHSDDYGYKNTTNDGIALYSWRTVEQKVPINDDVLYPNRETSDFGWRK